MLQGLVGRTPEFDYEPETTIEETNDKLASKIIERPRRRSIDEGDFAIGRWCFDTPGTVHNEQIINYLTLDELIKTVPRTMLRPRTYVLGKKETMFIGGLVRIDYLFGPRATMLTVFASDELPIYVEETEFADRLYKKYIGTAALAVPYGDEQRLKAFPSLQRQVVKLVGIGPKESCADVTLSSAGWIAVTAKMNDEVHLGVWTPGGVGIFVRTPPLLPFIVNNRGHRVAGSNAYEDPISIPGEHEDKIV